MSKIALGCDHGGLELKKYLIEKLNENGYETIDCGTYSTESCHYPKFAFAVGEAVVNKDAKFGIIICRTGEGVSIAANKVKGIRCGIGYNEKVSKLMREHNNANMIAFGADYITPEDAFKNTLAFLNSKFLAGRHQIRIDMIEDYEK